MSSAGGRWGQPSEEELAVILAAIEAAWPRSEVTTDADVDERHGPWRFAGRWWGRPARPGRLR